MELVTGSTNAFLAEDVVDQRGGGLCEVVGAGAIGCDPRIGRAMLIPGLGYSGGCLPQGSRALTARAQELGIGKSFGSLRSSTSG